MNSPMIKIAGLSKAFGAVRVLHDIDLDVASGEVVSILGPSGSGKSTLFRTIAGIWPFARGTLRTPADFDPLFLPQRPYFPLGTLRRAVAYPASPETFGDARIRTALEDVGLAHLATRLDEQAHWAQQLSGGEQQRIAFARALLQAPRWVFLDEATSNLDEAAEHHLYTLLTERLPQSTIVSITHRPGPARFHERIVDLDPSGGGSLRTAG